MNGFDLPLEPPVRYSKPRNWMLKTVGEAIDYINGKLTEEQQAHELVKAARERLYYAADTGLKADVTHAREVCANRKCR
jgi:hypothetical protein